MFLTFVTLCSSQNLEYLELSIKESGKTKQNFEKDDIIVFHNSKPFEVKTDSGDALGKTSYNILSFTDNSTITIKNTASTPNILSYTKIKGDNKCYSHSFYQNLENTGVQITKEKITTGETNCFYFVAAMSYDVEIKLSNFGENTDFTCNNFIVKGPNGNGTFGGQDQVEIKIRTFQELPDDAVALIQLTTKEKYPQTTDLIKQIATYRNILSVHSSQGMPIGAILGIIFGSLIAVGMFVMVCKLVCCPSKPAKVVQYESAQQNETVADVPNNQYWNDQIPQHDINEPLMENSPKETPYTVSS